jgi:hypothetical protein
MPAMRPPVHYSAMAAILAAALATPVRAIAFGPSGHRVAGYIADRYLCAETRAALTPLLAGMTLAEAGQWPDTLRSQPEWAHTKPWHYLNVSDLGSIARAARQNPDNVLAALARFEKELADDSLGNAPRELALRFVAHLVVDIHQPLHVGREGDRGGNLIPVRVAGRDTNLHAVWDGEQLQLPGGSHPAERARRLLTPTGAAVAHLQQASALEWARESQALRAQVYAFPRAREGPTALTPVYLDRARAMVDQRLVQAGVRLAGRLNALFGAPANCGPEVASPKVNL